MGDKTVYRVSNRNFVTVLHSVYEVINEQIFDNELPNVPIKIAAIAGTKDSDVYATFRITIRNMPHHLDRLSIIVNQKMAYFMYFPYLLEWAAEYMTHEMVHMLCFLRGIKDVDYRTQYHNTNFMVAAESHGLVCPACEENFGFMNTYITQNALDIIMPKIPEDILALGEKSRPARDLSLFSS